MIPPVAIASQLRASAIFPGGPTLGPLCMAIAQAVVAWLPTGVTITGVTTGVVGTGTVNGTLAFAANPAAVAQAMGFTGPNTSGIARMLTLGLNGSLTGSPYQGVSIGVGQGTDVSIVGGPNIPALVGLLQSSHAATCAGLGGTGSLYPGFYQGIANGIAIIVQSGVTLPVAQVTPSGPLGPASSVGTSLSALV